MKRSVSVISSMATRQILAVLIENYKSQAGVDVSLASVGGVDAAKRLRAGEPFDVAVLARDALERLAGDGAVQAASIVDFSASPSALAVRSGVQLPTPCDEVAIRKILTASSAVGISTGPSGKAVRKLLQQWGFGEPAARIVEAPPGIPVARLVAAGVVDVGFQQLSELVGETGIEVSEPLPDDVVPATVFSMAICQGAPSPAGAKALMQFLSSAAAVSVKLNGGMHPA